jgi:hypothetical protein
MQEAAGRIRSRFRHPVGRFSPEEKRSLVAFLHSLTGRVSEVDILRSL